MKMKDKKYGRNRDASARETEDGMPRGVFRDLHAETVRAVFAILFFVAAALLTLASQNRAGIAGASLYALLSLLLGVGYFLMPLLFFFIGISLLRPNASAFGATKIIGAVLFFLAGLGAIDITLPGKSGLVGSAIASPFIRLFDYQASMLLLIALFVISLLILFNARLAPQTFFSAGRSFFSALSGLFRRKNKNEPEEAADGDTLYDEEGISEDALAEEKRHDGAGAASLPNAPTAPVSAASAAPEIKSGAAEKDTLLLRSYESGSVYTPPPPTLLEGDRGRPGVGDIKANANIIKRTLQNFGITVEMDEISIGPSVTRYALKPAEGIKLSRIVGLKNDLALALAVHPLRIEAPIPGKSLVGIEIPNTHKTTVGLGGLVTSDEFQKTSSPLLITLGKGVSGKSHFANVEKMPHLLIAGATGSGKTCAKDTYIFSEKGILTFEEVCPLPLNSEVDYSLRVATRDGIETTSKNYNNGRCSFYKITTEEGLFIEVTREHPLWVIEDGVMRWKNGGSIQTGEYVAISRGSKLFGSAEQIAFTPTPDKTNKSKSIKIPTVMTPELGLFMGLLTADGGLTVGHRVVYTQTEGEVLDRYRGLLKDLFDISGPSVTKSGHSNKAKDVVVNSKQLKEFLAHLGITSAGAYEKEIPRSIRQSGPETIKAFIRGLIRNDGHVSPKAGLEITLASGKLLRQLQIALLNFGIVSSLHPKKVTGYEHNSYWRLAVYGADFVLYTEEIGFLTDDERSRARGVLARNRNTNKNVVPTTSPILKKLSRVYRGIFAQVTNKGWRYTQDSLVPKYAFNSLRSYNSGARNPSYEALEKILTFYTPLAYADEYKELTKICEDNFYWAKVATLERTTGEGYDFEVPGSHSFVGNGFVNHNSVTIHTIITSLLYRNAPENLRFIMIDPKRVELTLYNNIPHLLTPVITNAKQTILALKWAAKEMDRRYDVLEAESVRDIGSYHKNILTPALAKTQKNKKTGGEEEYDAKLPERMPYIMIIIDELADIMLAYPRELESAIVRLAQMSRAVGIHLILSTQRPSVNIITGLIKANIPTRIALQVASQIDSRTILDTGGAETLLGAGDMLYLSGDMSKPQRIQSAFISEGEVKRVVGFLSRQYGETLPDDITFSHNDGESDLFAGSVISREEGGDDDELYKEAEEVVARAGKASTSYLQRKLRIGYARAARLMDLLEERGVIGAADGSKPRAVIDQGYNGNEEETQLEEESLAEPL